MSADQKTLDDLNRPLTPEEQEAVNKLQDLVNEAPKTGFFPNQNPFPNGYQRRQMLKKSKKNLIRRVVLKFARREDGSVIKDAKGRPFLESTAVKFYPKPFVNMDRVAMWRQINQQPVEERPFNSKGKII